ADRYRSKEEVPHINHIKRKELSPCIAKVCISGRKGVRSFIVYCRGYLDKRTTVNNKRPDPFWLD
ncbi:MAG TPA: hypothetical protein VIK22_10895, partial [Candidatus Anoxymicrobiaceae bacterium]